MPIGGKTFVGRFFYYIGDPAGFTIRIDSDIVVRDSRRLAIAKRLVEMIHQYLDPNGTLPIEESLCEKGTGY